MNNIEDKLWRLFLSIFAALFLAMVFSWGNCIAFGYDTEMTLWAYIVLGAIIGTGLITGIILAIRRG